MARSIYELMSDAEEDRGEFDNLFPDSMTLQINKFRTNYTPLEYVITQGDVDRFDLLIYRAYGISDYTDIVLWYNNIGFKEDLEVGQTILLPDLKDINTFYIRYAR